ncbi:MAG: MFS transporter [Ardenticatenia bacterium]|nr:MFS transporter [Ardenticatenia bacterium]
MRSILRNRLFLAVATGHLAVDVMNSAIPIILASLALQLGLSNAQLGLAATVYVAGSSLSQPLFGHVADRWNSRSLAVGGVLWMGGAFWLAALLQGYAALACLLLAGLGSAAYHPQGVMNARRASEPLVASGTSLFFLFGQVGLGLGPVLAGLLLATTSLPVALVALGTLPVLASLWLVTLPPFSHHGRSSRPGAAAASPPALRLAWPILAAFLALMALRFWPTSATQTFLPKLMGERGLGAEWYGLVLAGFMAGSAIGGVLGGMSADRWSAKGTLVTTLAVAPVPLWLYLQVPLDHPLVLVLMAVAGALLGAQHSILVIMAQAMLPHRMGLASGLVLGYMFTAGALGSLVTGVVADRLGLERVLEALPLVVIGALICALLMPRRRLLEAASEPAAVPDRGEGHSPCPTRA